jgi:hypothetical protein
MTNEIEKHVLPCILTQAERAERGAALGREAELLEATEEEKKESAASFKKKIDGHKAEVMRLARIVRTGKESREVPCGWKLDLLAESVHLIRLDTGEVVRSRPMTPEEREAARQAPLPGIIEPPVVASPPKRELLGLPGAVVVIPEPPAPAPDALPGVRVLALPGPVEGPEDGDIEGDFEVTP